MKKLVSFCVAAVMGCVTAFGASSWAAEPVAQAQVPVDLTLDGAFIQPYLYWNYTDEQWDTEMEVLKGVGVKSLIMGDVLQIHRDRAWEFYYPSELPEAKNGKYVGDAIGPLLEKCKQYGMKVYLGMGIDPYWWSANLADPGDAAWFAQFCRDSARVAEEIYSIYHEQYADTFAGWYAVPEIWNHTAFNDDQMRSAYADALSNGFNIVIEQIEKMNPAMPVFFSPFTTRKGFATLTNTQSFYTELFEKTNFRKIDAMLPMDNIGGGGMKLPYLDSYTKMYSDAVKASGNKLQFWTNNETFIQSGSDPLGKTDTWGTASIGRYVEQLGITKKYAAQTFSFAYSHYYSPVATVAGYHETYLTYLKTGRLDSQPPLAPNRVKTQMSTNGLQISWSGMYDDKGISRVNIYRNGEFYDYVPASNTQYGTNAIHSAPTKFTDSEILGSSSIIEPITYEIEAVDCAGNVSAKRAKVVVTRKNYNNGAKVDAPYIDEWDKNDPMGLTRPAWVNDVNEDDKITSLDALCVLEYVSGLRELTARQKTAADTNGDRSVRSLDAMRILELVAGMDTGLSR